MVELERMLIDNNIILNYIIGSGARQFGLPPLHFQQRNGYNQFCVMIYAAKYGYVSRANRRGGSMLVTSYS
jgi:hypothetical protein